MTVKPSLKYFAKFLELKNRYISHRAFVLMLSAVVGLSAGLAVALLKNCVHLIEALLTTGFAENYQNYLYFIYPAIGLLLTVFITKRFLFNKHVGHGIPNTLYAISKKNSFIRRISMISSFITAAITVGFGGSTGLEGPTVGTSTAIGANLGKLFRVNYQTRTLLIGCAASAALAAIFKAPIAAIIFALEVIMLDLTLASMLPILVASVVAALTSILIFGDDILLNFHINEDLALGDLGYYVLLGIATGLGSLYFSKIFFWVSGFFEKNEPKYNRAIIGGLILGALIFFFPPLYGEGYSTINALIEGNYQEVLNNSPFATFKDNMPAVLIFLTAMIMLKAIATSVTITSGGVGGIFAPTLFMGCVMGFSYATAMNYFFDANLPVSHFTLVGMAGLMAGNLQAPLTAIFLIAEITGGYALFIPLMISASIAYLTVKYFLPHSVYTMQLAKRGELLTHDKDQAVLTLMKLKSEIETDFSVINPEMSLGSLVKVVAKSKRNLFPVIDDDHKFLGTVNLNDIRETMFNQELYNELYVSDLMEIAPELISSDDNMDEVMKKFEKSGAWNLPVLENEIYVGFVSKSKLFSAYRKRLKDFYPDR